jgi:aldehyde reductase
MPLNHGIGHMPALGFGSLIPDAAATIRATKDALEAGFRHFDCAERYRNEREVGEALQAGLASGEIVREDLFVTTKLWNTNHRPERVVPAFETSLERLRVNYLDLFLIHTPFAFKPGDEQDPRDWSARPRLLKLGAVECMLKPFSEADLLEALDAAFRIN